MTAQDKPFSMGQKLRAAEKALVKGLIRWRIGRSGMPPIAEDTLDRGAEHLLDQAHSIIRVRGRDILNEAKLARDEFKRAYRGEDEQHHDPDKP